MSKNKTLIILSPGFPENEKDSTCLPPQQVFVKALKQTHPDLNIIVLAFQYPFISSEYTWNGIKIISFNGRNRGKINRLIVWIHVWKTLKKIKRENEIIGLLSFWLGECAFIGKYFAKKYNLKHYCWILGQDAKPGNKYFRLTKPQGNSLIALSDFIAREFFKNYHVLPKHIIPVGIDTSLYRKSTIERDIDILGAGSLIALKQYDLFIHIIKFLRNIYPNIHSVICGKGPEKEKLFVLIKEQQLENNVSLLGEIAHTEVLALMQRSKIFLHPSIYEGFGTVLLEALYAGAHVVSFVKPMNEAFKHHHIVNTTEEMSNKILELLQNETLDHEPVMTFSATGIVEKMMKLF